jgi:murein biosynthesis integral membrane protein MurJ
LKGDIQRVLLFSLLAQAAGFAKSLLIAFYFGIGAELDGYYLAQIPPVFLSGVVVGALQAGLMPVYSSLIANQQAEKAAALIGSVLLGLIVLTGIASIALAVAAPTLVHLLSPGSSRLALEAGATSLAVLAFLLLLNGVADFLALILNAHLKFAAAALAPVANAAVASALLVFAPEWGLLNLVWGTLLGLAVQLVIVAIAFRRTKVQIQISLKAPADVRTVAVLATTMVPGLVLANATGAVPQLWASSLGDGALSAFSYAQRIHGAAVQAFAMALSTVLLPHFSRQLARSNEGGIAAGLRHGTPLLALLGVAAIVWVGLVGTDALKLLFMRGAFDAKAVAAVHAAWLWLTFGLVPTIWVIVLAKVLQAARKGALLSANAVATLGLTVILCAWLGRVAGLAGIAAAVGLAYAATVPFLAWVVDRRLRQEKMEPAEPTGPGRRSLIVGPAIVIGTFGFLTHAVFESLGSIPVLVAVTATVGLTCALGYRWVSRSVSA